jgi:hypothetical protein
MSLPTTTAQPPFYYIDDGVPEATTRLLQEACGARSVSFVPVNPYGFDFRPERQLRGGELLYRPAVSMAALRVEQFLFANGVATFHRCVEDLFNDCMTPSLWFQREGLPIPRTIYCATTDRTLLRDFVEQLGGFPIVLKVPGFESGLGVMRVDAFPTLFSFVDFALHQGFIPMLMAYIPEAIHWRLIVLGDRVVASYQNIQEEDDFRTYAPATPEHYMKEPPPEMTRIAVQAVSCRGSEFGGVDLLQHASGRCYLLEANFPCYFPQAQEVAGVDIAGLMIDYLLAKARRLAEASARGDRKRTV